MKMPFINENAQSNHFCFYFFLNFLPETDSFFTILLIPNKRLDVLCLHSAEDMFSYSHFLPLLGGSIF